MIPSIFYKCMHFLVKMNAVMKIKLLVIVLTFINCIFKCAAELIVEDCGDVQYDVENGMIRLPDFSGESIRDLNCSWTYTAPAGRKLLVKVDSVHLPPLELRTSQFQLYIDDRFYDIPRNCVKCLREMVAGKVLNVIFTSYVIPASESHIFNVSEISSGAEGIGSFQVRYKAFDPHRCAKPEPIENGYITNKSRKVGQSIFYHCYPPYDLVGDSELRCYITSETPVPEWNNKIPKCVIQDCVREPIIKRGKQGAIASPGYPSYLYHFTTPCIWEINAQPNQQIKVSIIYLKFSKTPDNSFTENISRLSLLDGDYNNYIVNITESLTNGVLNFTTLTNKLTVEFIVNEDPKKKEEAGVYINYSFVSSSCPQPRAPENGEIIAYSTDLGSTITYTCKEGFVAVGELHAECLFNGQWSHPTPSCESNYEIPLFLSATNDSDTVTAKFPEIPAAADNMKYPKNGKKKASEVLLVKDGQNFTENKENVVISKDLLPRESKPKDHQSKDNQLQDHQSKDKQLHIHQLKVNQPKDPQQNDNQPKENETTENFSSTHQPYNKVTVTKSPKNSDKEFSSGPKSEPHLLQVVPPKENGKKTTVDDGILINRNHGKTILNASEPQEQEQLPQLETGLTQVFDIGGIKISLTMIYIIAGVGGPLLIIFILLIVLVVYRKKYPVRMRFGRKFSTFENPMYVTKDAQHPRELKRLTN